MRLLTIFLFVASLAVSARPAAQTVTLSGKNLSLKQVFAAIKKQTNYVVLSNEELLSNTRPVSLTAQDMPLRDLLDVALKEQSLGYVIQGKTIFLSRVSPALSSSGILSGRPALPVASPQTITGTVSTSDGLPIVGASVLLKPGGRGAATNHEGAFLLRNVAPGEYKLEISNIGYRRVERKITVGDATVTLRIEMELEVSEEEESVVIGYGTQSRRNVTGAISKLGTPKPEENITSTLLGAMQGRVAGLTVKNYDGTPGAPPSFSVRGVQTTNVNSVNPLIVIDGMIVDAGHAEYSNNNQNFNLNNINPQDIESVEVLKDAASAGIYGARGSQGVILITTKKGKFNSKPVVNVNYYYGLTSSKLGFRSLNNQQYQEVYTDARSSRIADIDRLLSDGNLPPSQIAQLQNERTLVTNEINALVMGTPAGLEDNDWVDKVTPARPATSNMQASISGGNQQTSYYFSFGRYMEENSVGTGKYARYSGKLAITQKVNAWLKIGGDLNISKSQKRNFTMPLVNAIGARPDTPDSIRLNADGSYGWWFGRQGHPLADERSTSSSVDNLNYMGNVFGEVTLRRSLSFRSLIAGVQNNSSSVSFYSPISYSGASVRGLSSNAGNSGLQYTFNNTLTYKFDAGLLGGDVLLGQEYYENKKTTTGFSITGFPMLSDLWAPGNGSAYSNGDIYQNRVYEENGNSYFLRSNLSLSGKYLFSASVRRDATSKLMGDNRSSWFPAASAGWVLSDEPFFGSLKGIDLLKLKTGYGITGNIRSLGYFDFADLAVTNTYLGMPALTLSNIKGNPGLRWERTKQYDLGLETRFLNSRMAFTLEFYHKKTDGVITNVMLPYGSGFASQKLNIGDVLNRGLDIQLSYTSKPSGPGHLQWNAGVVLNLNHNEVLNLRDSVINYGSYFPGGPLAYARIGESMGSLLLYRSLGVDPDTGDLMYEDKDKNGVINQLDQEYVNVAQPKYVGGFDLGFSWKNISVSSHFSFSVGSKIYNLTDQTSRTFNIDGFGIMSNKVDWVNDRWRAPGDDSYYPRAIVGVHGAGQTSDWNARPSTHYLFNGSYLRFNNLTAGYTLPATVLKRTGMSQLRMYVSAQNLFIIKARGLKSPDPEIGLQTGIQHYMYMLPIPRTIALGIDLSL